MMSSKSIAKWYELKQKGSKGRTYTERLEYKQLSLQRSEEKLEQEDQKCRVELFNIILDLAAQGLIDLNPLKQSLQNVPAETIKPFKSSDLLSLLDSNLKTLRIKLKNENQQTQTNNNKSQNQNFQN